MAFLFSTISRLCNEFLVWPKITFPSVYLSAIFFSFFPSMAMITFIIFSRFICWQVVEAHDSVCWVHQFWSLNSACQFFQLLLQGQNWWWKIGWKQKTRYSIRVLAQELSYKMVLSVFPWQVLANTIYDSFSFVFLFLRSFFFPFGQGFPLCPSCVRFILPHQDSSSIWLEQNPWSGYDCDEEQIIDLMTGTFYSFLRYGLGFFWFPTVSSCV